LGEQSTCLIPVTVHDLYATYPDFQINVDAEQALRDLVSERLEAVECR
jgi:hypothetical protein